MKRSFEALASYLMGLEEAIFRAEPHPDLFNDREDLQSVLSDWYVPIAAAILQHWQFSEDVIAAVSAQQERDRDASGSPDLADVLIVAVLLPGLRNQAPEQVIAALKAAATAERLGISPEDVVNILKESEEQILALKQALGN